MGKSDDFEFGFENPTPIITREIAGDYFTKLKRVEYQGLAKDSPPPQMDNAALVIAMLAALARGSASETRSKLCFLAERPRLADFKSEISNLKLVAESYSRQLRAWAESLQDSDIRAKGT